MNKRDELYAGKAKSVFYTDDADYLILEFRDDTSAFDGKRVEQLDRNCLLYTSPSPRDLSTSRMPSSA